MENENVVTKQGTNRAKLYQLVLFPMNNGRYIVTEVRGVLYGKDKTYRPFFGL